MIVRESSKQMSLSIDPTCNALNEIEKGLNLQDGERKSEEKRVIMGEREKKKKEK